MNIKKIVLIATAANCIILIHIQAFKNEQAIIATYNATKAIHRPVERSEAAKRALEQFFKNPEEDQIKTARELATLISEEKPRLRMVEKIDLVERIFQHAKSNQNIMKLKQKLQDTQNDLALAQLTIDHGIQEKKSAIAKLKTKIKNLYNNNKQVQRALLDIIQSSHEPSLVSVLEEVQVVGFQFKSLMHGYVTTPGDQRAMDDSINKMMNKITKEVNALKKGLKSIEKLVQ